MNRVSNSTRGRMALMASWHRAFQSEVVRNVASRPPRNVNDYITHSRAKNHIVPFVCCLLVRLQSMSMTCSGQELIGKPPSVRCDVDNDVVGKPRSIDMDMS